MNTSNTDFPMMIPMGMGCMMVINVNVPKAESSRN